MKKSLASWSSDASYLIVERRGGHSQGIRPDYPLFFISNQSQGRRNRADSSFPHVGHRSLCPFTCRAAAIPT
jgi:hypothetical protein